MTFDEWFHKEYEPADLQIKQYAERKEGLHIPATCYLEDLKEAFEAGLHADVYTDNSKVIAELENEVHTWKEANSTNSYKAFQLREENKTLSKHIVELQNDKGELVDRCKELEAKIEQMKRCEICKHYRWNHCSYEIKISVDCIQNKMKHFELREIKEK